MTLPITRQRTINRWLVRTFATILVVLILFLFFPSLILSEEVVDILIAIMLLSAFLGVLTKGHRKIGEMTLLSSGVELALGRDPRRAFSLDEMNSLQIVLYYYRGKQIGLIKIFPDAGVMNKISFRADDVDYRLHFTVENRRQLLTIRALMERWLEMKPDIDLHV